MRRPKRHSKLGQEISGQATNPRLVHDNGQKRTQNRCRNKHDHNQRNLPPQFTPESSKAVTTIRFGNRRHITASPANTPRCRNVSITRVTDFVSRRMVAEWACRWHYNGTSVASIRWLGRECTQCFTDCHRVGSI